MTARPKDEVRDALRALNEQFAERLRRELPALAAQAERLSGDMAGERRAIELDDLRSRLHRLAGAAGSFGQPALGREAWRLEQRIARWLEASEPAEAGFGELAEAMRELARKDLSGAGDTAPVPSLEAEPAGQCIYLMESDPQACRLISQTLRTFGYQVQACHDLDGLEALFRQQPPDALVLALHACDALTRVKALQAGLERPLPLMVIGERDDFDIQLAAVRAGAEGFFTRPLDLTRLESRLARSLERQQGEPYRVLIVDDDADLTLRYSLVLRGARMEVQALDEPVRLFETLHAFNPEVVLLDLNMPGCSGLELAQMIRLHDDWLRIPIIYLSVETDASRQMEALVKAGDDFITKPISDSALVSAVFSHAQRARALSAALTRDGLTGLLTHASIKEQLLVEVDRARRSGRPACVVMLDIDRFKQVNDSHGHAAGDSVIRALANLLRQRLRRVDSLGRYGGEEFLAVLPDCSATQALRIFDHIRERFAELTFSAGGASFQATLSAGICETNPALDAGTLLEQADRALYAAKHGGRNQVCVAD
ncbi:diguanylate cyclase [Stutzerimonas azotifigens]|uniref:diguanylate cyclase n=1 Tax=Stutzerimonas azotifigens TaxID=291995 RepID=UPI000485389E|nr:diguanylate cyclase [Stutzerimonas azotifigens]